MKLNCLIRPSGLILSAVLLASCGQEPEPEVSISTPDTAEVRPEIYADFTLTADLSHLSDDQKRMIVLLIEASEIMDDLFWRQSYGDDYAAWLDSLDDERARRFAELNYGPWDALDDDKPFVAGFGPKPLGAQFYPADMSREEFENAFLRIYATPTVTDRTCGIDSLTRRRPEGSVSAKTTGGARIGTTGRSGRFFRHGSRRDARSQNRASGRASYQNTCGL